MQNYTRFAGARIRGIRYACSVARSRELRVQRTGTCASLLFRHPKRMLKRRKARRKNFQNFESLPVTNAHHFDRLKAFTEPCANVEHLFTVLFALNISYSNRCNTSHIVFLYGFSPTTNVRTVFFTDVLIVNSKIYIDLYIFKTINH